MIWDTIWNGFCKVIKLVLVMFGISLFGLVFVHTVMAASERTPTTVVRQTDPLAVGASSARLFAKATLPTAPTLSGKPNLSNFYIEASGYAIYGGTGTIDINAYNASSDGQLYGFYLVLPIQVTGQLAEIQTAANTFVTDLQNYMQGGQHFYTIASIKAYQLDNTTDGREVFYFRPNDGATKMAGEPATWVKFHVPIQIKAKKDLSPSEQNAVKFNANNNAELLQYSVLFAGFGDIMDDVSGTAYPTITPSQIGVSEAPDTYIAAITVNGIRRTLNLTDATVIETYNVVNADTGAPIKTITKTGQTGTTYSRVGLVDTLASLGLDSKQYWAPSLTIDSGTLTDTAVPFVPTTWFAGSANPTVPGHTYTIKVSPIKTNLQLKPVMITPGSKWQLSDSVQQLTGPDGKNLSLTDVKATGVDQVNTNAAGQYPISISYTDAQGNVTTAKSVVMVGYTDRGLAWYDSDVDGVYTAFEHKLDGSKQPIRFQLFKQNTVTGAWTVAAHYDPSSAPTFLSTAPVSINSSGDYQLAIPSAGTFKIGIAQADLQALHYSLTKLNGGYDIMANSAFDSKVTGNDGSTAYYLTQNAYTIPATGALSIHDAAVLGQIAAGVYTSQVGLISLTPPTLDFGKQVIPYQTATYTNQNAAGNQLIYSDNRTVFRSPFSISVQAGDFIDQTDSQHSVGLQQSFLTFQQLGAGMPSFKVYTGGSDVTLFTVENSKAGATMIMLNPPQLTVPGVSGTTTIQANHQYQAKLTWTLTDGI
ncbi:bacterial Ig-like domain-containing protein [Schleiferilactobacillus harbinensis]|uniref:bacterial Ig-like domain-containing protein n=1 Tax=Schleiferilactobacillus harbinensis TaxID=304207 RepID=UPI0007BA1ED6|nr:bacterial Ig-like domain-containing protein [Schleiferilactobacillus harbinensis]